GPLLVTTPTMPPLLSTLFPYTTLFRSQWVDVPQLAALIEQEHLQLQAVFLAFLPPDVAAGVLSALSQERQDEIVWRIARLDDVKDRKSTRLNSSHVKISYAVFCLKKTK